MIATSTWIAIFTFLDGLPIEESKSMTDRLSNVKASLLRRFVQAPRKRKRLTAQLNRRLSSETLEKRQMLAADLAGDDLASAHVVSLQPNQMQEFDASIGDGLFGVKDVDLYRVDIVDGQTVTFDVDAYYDDNGNNLSNLDSYLRIFDSAGTDITPGGEYYRYGYASSPNDYGGYGWADDYLSFTADQTATYYVGVSSQSNTSYDPTVGDSGYGHASYTGAYRLQVLGNSPPVPELSVADLTAQEDDGMANVVVSLSAESTSVVTVDFSVVAGSALAGTDYTSSNGTLTFSPGEVSKSIPVGIVDDGAMESDETFTVQLSNAVGAPITMALATIEIVDDDPDLAGDQLSTAQTVTLSGGSLLEIDAEIGDGRFGNKDVDLYRLDIATGQTVTFDVDA